MTRRKLSLILVRWIQNEASKQLLKQDRNYESMWFTPIPPSKIYEGLTKQVNLNCGKHSELICALSLGISNDF